MGFSEILINCFLKKRTMEVLIGDVISTEQIKFVKPTLNRFYIFESFTH